MATSGSQNYKQTRNQVMLDALQLIGVYGIGRTASAEDMELAQNTLNKMIKAWGAKGLHLWTKKEGVVFLTPYTASYKLGSASGDAHATNEDDLVVTQLNGAHVSGATTLTLDSTTNMAVSDYIGIVTTDKTVHWTTISTIPSSTSVTIASGLDSAASDNGIVYAYTTKLYKPLRILDARMRSGIDSGATSTEVDSILSASSYQEYHQFLNKTTNGSPTLYSYEPKNLNGTFSLYPRPTDGAERVMISYERTMEDMDEASNDFDFPSEWLEPLTWQLAVRLAPMFGKSQKLTTILPLASTMLENLLDWNTEITTITMSPEFE